MLGAHSGHSELGVVKGKPKHSVMLLYDHGIWAVGPHAIGGAEHAKQSRLTEHFACLSAQHQLKLVARGPIGSVCNVK